MAPVYRPLYDPRMYFRVIHLPIRRASDGVLSLTVQTVGMHDDINRYIAISYEWGPETPVKTIRVDGHNFRVRQNIWRFLEHCCDTDLLSDHDLTMWIDAICIDQQNVIEKSAQVQAIGSIFRRAERVLVWFGEASEDSEIGDYILAYQDHRKPKDLTLSRSKHRTPSAAQTSTSRSTSDDTGVGDAQFFAVDELFRAVFEGSSPSVGQKEHAHTLISENEILTLDTKLRLRTDLRRLIGNSYWQRLWIVQEICLADETCFVSGSKLLSSAVFARACKASVELGGDFMENLITGQMFVTGMRPLSILNLSCERYGLSIQKLVYRFALQKCQDPRDHVYGLLGISVERFWMKFDYNISCEALLCVVMEANMGAGPSIRKPFAISRMVPFIRALDLDPKEVAMHLARRRSKRVAFARRTSLPRLEIGNMDSTRLDIVKTAKISAAKLLRDGKNWLGLVIFSAGDQHTFKIAYKRQDSVDSRSTTIYIRDLPTELMDEGFFIFIEKTGEMVVSFSVILLLISLALTLGITRSGRATLRGS